MVETFSVDIYETDTTVYFEDSDAIFLKLTNTVAPGAEGLWRVDEDGVVRIDINESTINRTDRFEIEDFGEQVQSDAKLEYVQTSGGLFIIGESNAIPAYSPFDTYHRETEQVYRIHGAFMGSEHPGDEYLNVEPIEESVLVENIDTGVTVPVDKETVLSDLDNGVLEYALHVQE